MATRKVRKQIYLTRWQEERLQQIASQAGRPEAEIIRSALDAYFVAIEELPKDDPLSALAGIGSSGSSGSKGAEEHDRVIYGA